MALQPSRAAISAHSGRRGGEEPERGLPVMAFNVRVRADYVRRPRWVVEPRAERVDWDAPPDEAGWVRLLLPFEKLEFARADADVEVLGPQINRPPRAPARYTEPGDLCWTAPSTEAVPNRQLV